LLVLLGADTLLEIEQLEDALAAALSHIRVIGVVRMHGSRDAVYDGNVI